MVDTIRTLAAIQALLADNVTKDISPQDHRDQLVSSYVGVAIKGSVESVTSSIALQDDNDLVLPLLASVDYAVLGILFADGATGGDLRLAWTLPAGATGNHASFGPAQGSSSFDSQSRYAQMAGHTTGMPAGMIGANNWVPVPVFLGVIMDATAGDVQLQWAQWVVSGTATRLNIGSFLIALPVNN